MKHVKNCMCDENGIDGDCVTIGLPRTKTIEELRAEVRELKRRIREMRKVLSQVIHSATPRADASLALCILAAPRKAKR